MNVILGALVRRIKQRAYLDTDEEIARWIEEYCEQSNSHNCPFTQTCPECTKPATEPLPAEGSAKSVRVGCKNYDFHGSDILRYGRCAYCGNTE